MKRQIITFFSLIFLTMFAFAYAVPSPVPMLENTANQLINQLQKNKNQLKTNPKLIYSFVKTIVLPHIDEQQMARSVVTKTTWTNSTTAQQQQFVNQFRDLVIRTYSSAFANYTSETVKFRPLRPVQLHQNYLTVSSVILRSGAPSIPVTYSMNYKNGQWFVVDFSVDGVSMVNSFKSQFASLESNKGLAGLTAILQKHNNPK